jgi:hypothetical protein
VEPSCFVHVGILWAITLCSISCISLIIKQTFSLAQSDNDFDLSPLSIIGLKLELLACSKTLRAPLQQLT